MFTPFKPMVVFYEKRGCSGNKRQQELLQKHGITLEIRSLLDTPWSIETLEPFFEGLGMQEMLNPFAPQVKDGSFALADYTKEQLMAHMVDEPLLIRRPLLQIGEVKICGFDIEKLNTLLHVKMPNPININACLSSDTCTTD